MQEDSIKEAKEKDFRLFLFIVLSQSIIFLGVDKKENFPVFRYVFQIFLVNL